MSKNTNIYKNLDWGIVVLYLCFVLLGWMNIYGASHDIDQTSIFDFAYFSGKQFVWIICAFVMASLMLLVEGRTFQTISMLLYVCMILLLFVTAVVAPDINGSRSWLRLGPLSIQPAEFSKFITALAVANVMSQYGFKLNTFEGYLKVCSLLLLPMLAIVLEKETGSALVYASFMLMLYREGLPGLIPLLALCCIVLFITVIRFSALPFFGIETAPTGLVVSLALLIILAYVMLLVYKNRKIPVKYLTIGLLSYFALAFIIHLFGLLQLNFVYVCLLAIVAFSIYVIVFAFKERLYKLLLIVVFLFGFTGYCYSANYLFDNVLQPHQQMRIKVLLGMIHDPGDVGYNVEQAKIAIGSGGFSGKGFLNGTQTSLRYVPEQHTDFIFCTVGEEHGFIGAFVVIALYLIFLYRLVTIAERQHESFARIYGYCVVGIFLFHLIVNVGMVIGLMPVIGIPLPFFSYGGSSLWSFTILLFIFLRLDIDQKVRGR